MDMQLKQLNKQKLEEEKGKVEEVLNFEYDGMAYANSSEEEKIEEEKVPEKVEN